MSLISHIDLFQHGHVFSQSQYQGAQDILITPVI
jgi:hypothetical protein